MRISALEKMMAPKPGTKSHSPAPDPSPISGIKLSGFKSIRDEISLPIRNLTLLAGQNSAGKTSAMQPLLLLKQTLEAPFDPGPLLLDGPCVQVKRTRELIWSGTRKGRSWSLEIQVEGRPDPIHFGLGIGIRKERGEETAVLLESRYAQGENRFTLDGTETVGELDLILRMFGFDRNGSGLITEVERIRSVYNVTMGLDLESREQRAAMRHVVISPLPAEQIRGIIHLPGLRVSPKRDYPSTSVTQFPGRFDDYVASVLDHWKTTDPDRLESVGQDLGTLNLATGVDPRRVDETRIELFVPRVPTKRGGISRDQVNIIHVGFGVSQVLPVIVALRAAKPGQLVHIEQPEIHLHPNAQVQLAQLLVAAANRGVRVVAETHSSLVLKAVQLLVAEGGISPKDVALHWFSRGKDGATKVDTADLDNHGTYGPWPVDFADVELDVERKFLRSQF